MTTDSCQRLALAVSRKLLDVTMAITHEPASIVLYRCGQRDKTRSCMVGMLHDKYITFIRGIIILCKLMKMVEVSYILGMRHCSS